MTVESYAQAPAYTISGVGPYPIPHPYLTGTIVAYVLIEDVPTQLAEGDFSVDPVMAADQGNLLLTSAAAATHDGRTLWIERATPLEQGWMARDDGREAGMEAQLDQDVMGAQEDRAQINAALRARKPMAPYDPIANTVPVVRSDGNGYANGPTLTQIYSAEQNAQDALAARKAAEAAALSADSHKDTFTALDAATDIAVGQVVDVDEGYNKQRERGKTVPTGTYASPDGVLVRNLSSSGLQWVSARTDFADFTEMDTDIRPLAAGTILTCASIDAVWKVVATGEHFTTAGGRKVQIVLGESDWLDFRWTGAVSGAADHSAYWDIATTASKKILLPPGTWAFNYKSIPAEAKIKGARWLTIVKPTTYTIRAALTADSGSTSAFLDEIEIEGITFRGEVEMYGGFQDDSSYGQKHLLTLHGVRRCTVKECSFIGYLGDGIYLGSGDTGGQERHNQEVRIVDCHFDGITKHNRNGLSVIDCDGLEVTGCLFENSTWDYAPGAIDLEPNDSWSFIRNINIHHNRFRNLGAACVGCLLNLGDTFFANRPYSIQITDNQAENVETGFSVASRETVSASTYSSGVEIKRNRVVNSGKPFFVHGVRGLRIEDNDFIGSTRPAEMGYNIWNIAEAKIRNNVFFECASDDTYGRAAILFADVNGLDMDDNEFIDCGRSDGSTGFGLELASGKSGSNIRLRRNRFSAPTGRTTRAIRMSGYTYTNAACLDEDNIFEFATVHEFSAPKSRHFTAAPASGTWATGDVVYNSDPSTGVFGWVCTSGGSPGTWVAIETQRSTVFSVTTTYSGTLAQTATDETLVYSGTLTGAAVGDLISVAPKFNPLGCKFRGVIVATNTLRLYAINQSNSDQSFSNPAFTIAWRKA